jgi:hypothetical protein
MNFSDLLSNKLVIIGALVGLYVFYRLFLKDKKNNIDDLDKEYNKVLNSEEYKVKSQWE